MRRQSKLCNLVHALGADLHFHPFLLRAHHRDVQALVAVGLRDRQPVPHAVRIGLVHVGQDGIGVPTFGAFLLCRCIQYNTDGEKVVYILKLHLLLFQLVVDGMNRLGAPLDVKPQPRLFQLLLYRRDKLLNIGIARPLRLVQFMPDELKLLRLGIFQHQVLQLALYRIQSQPMRQRSIQRPCLRRKPQPFILIHHLLAQPHHAQAVGDHQQYHPHILGKGEQQMPEVLRIDRRILRVKVGRFQQQTENVSRVGIKQLLNLLDGKQMLQHRTVKQ
ncbi:hypothetical protein Barb4_04766 [Bacteroidales bacterium Barb4]|nr:hypothetical protein Barb4_04766 [Bacteroidales bacterium Barb4]